MTDKPSLAERIEAIAGELWRNHGGDDMGLSAIAGELREIAGAVEDEAEQLGLHGGRTMTAKDQDIHANRLYALIDRLARREK